jgi:hypothetical protein
MRSRFAPFPVLLSFHLKTLEVLNEVAEPPFFVLCLPRLVPPPWYNCLPLWSNFVDVGVDIHRRKVYFLIRLYNGSRQALKIDCTRVDSSLRKAIAHRPEVSRIELLGFSPLPQFRTHVFELFTRGAIGQKGSWQDFAYSL